MIGGKKNTGIKMVRMSRPVIAAVFLMVSINYGMSQMKWNDNLVVAHRGAWKKNLHPENSIAALREAIRLKCLGSEFDVRMTLDDSLVINHDPHYHGMDIEKSTFKELSVFPLTNGEPVPTLWQYLLAGTADNPGTQLVVELKPSSSGRGRQMAHKTVELVRQLQAESRVLYISFDLAILTAILEKEPSANTQYLNGDQSPDQLKSMGITGLDYRYDVYKKNPHWIEQARKIGLQLNVWTVNDTADFQWFIERHFDAITTNEPELLLEMLHHKR